MDDKAEGFADSIVELFKNGEFNELGIYISESLRDALNKINWKSVY